MLIRHTKLPRISFTLVNNLHLLLGHEALVHTLHVFLKYLLELFAVDLEVSIEHDDLVDVWDMGLFAYDHIQHAFLGLNVEH